MQTTRGRGKRIIQRLDNIQLGQASKRCRVSDENGKEKPRAMKSVLEKQETNK